MDCLEEAWVERGVEDRMILVFNWAFMLPLNECSIEYCVRQLCNPDLMLQSKQSRCRVGINVKTKSVFGKVLMPSEGCYLFF